MPDLTQIPIFHRQGMARLGRPMPKKTKPAPRYRHRVTRKGYVLIHEKDGDYLEGIDRHRLQITSEKLTSSDTWERLP